MVVKGGPKIVSDGLVFNLDAAGAVSDRAYPINGLPVEYLIVAGGGGGGGSPHGAGGGAGGLLHGYTKASLSTGSYTITVGGGGAGKVGKKTSPWPSAGTNYGANGGNSTAFGKTALGGGGGGGYSGSGGNDTVGKSGGSGGGTGRDPSGVGQATQPSSSDGGFGNNGGRGGYSFGFSSGRNQAGGGGGAGARGDLKDSYIESQVSRGGIGRYYGYTFGRSLGDDGWFAGGGGGSFWSSTANQNLEATASLGGGGRGAHGNSSASLSNPVDGMANTGGGGGGSERHVSGDGIGGDGGSGIVIIKYKGPQKATGGDSIITRRGYTIHVFTSSGTFTVGGRVAGLSTRKIVGTLNFMDSTNYSSANRGYFSFNGSDEYITFPLNNPSGDWVHSIVFWMYLNSDQSAISSRVDPFQIGSVSDNSQYSAVDITNNNFNWYFFRNDTRVNTNIFSGQQWYHIGLTYSGGGGTTSTKKFYLNSVYTPWNLTSGAVYGNNLAIAGNTTLTIGRDTPRTTAYFPGRIAAFRIYNRTLSANEVEQNYNSTKGRFGL